MKNLKIVFASLFMLALTTVFATKASAQTTRYFEYIGTGGFTIANGTDAQLTNTSNWSQPSSAPSASGSGKIAFFTISYSGTAPSDVDLLSALASRYTENNAPVPDAFVFDSGSTTTITIVNVGGTGTTVTYVLTQKS